MWDDGLMFSPASLGALPGRQEFVEAMIDGDWRAQAMRRGVCFEALLISAGVEAATAATVADVIAVASAATTAAGFVTSGNAARAQGEFNAQVADFEAAEAKRVAAFEEERQRDRARRFLGAQRAGFGGSGVGVDDGTPLLVIEETAVDTELDALAIRYGGTREAVRRRAEGAGQRLQGEAIRSGSIIRAGAAVLTGLSDVGAGRTENKTKLGDVGGVGTPSITI